MVYVWYIYIYTHTIRTEILYNFIMYTSYCVSVGDPTMHKTFVCLDIHLEGLKMARIGVETAHNSVIY